MDENFEHSNELEDLLQGCIYAKCVEDIMERHSHFSLKDAKDHFAADFKYEKRNNEESCCLDIWENYQKIRLQFVALNIDPNNLGNKNNK